MALVIVESAAKSKTIQKYLNQSETLKKLGPFKVVASLGHVVDLPQKDLGVDTESWDLTYETIAKKSKVIQELKKAAKEAKQVYLASDPDREGEAIAFHLKRILSLKNPKRVMFHEITPKALEQAMTNPTDIDMSMVASQESRRALDRVVGFKVSPLLWRRFTQPGLSAGRVQSVVLRNVVERYKNYEAHEMDSYWMMEGTFTVNKTMMEGDLVEKGTQKKVSFEDPKETLDILEDVQKNKKATWNITYEMKTSHKNPSAPYITSALQQEAYELHKIPGKSTMQLAQKLYEGGFITYMRTDSVALSEDANKMIKDYIVEKYSEVEYHNRVFKSKVANAQEAHECIRPTHVSVLAKDLPDEMTASHRKIYDLIWRKAVASQMVAAEYIDIIYRLQCHLSSLKKYEFYGKTSLLQTPGYLKVWDPKKHPMLEEIELWKQRMGKKIEKITVEKMMSRGNITRPEGLYNEPGIIKWMEKEGIGRPSTYATIVDKLFDKGYITKGSNPLKTETVEHYILENKEIQTSEETLQMGGTEKDKFIPTALGENITEYLYETLPKLMDYQFTATMEESLDEISRKEKTKKEVMGSFYQEFEPIVEKAIQEMKEYRKKHKKEKKEDQELAPKTSNIIKEFQEEDTNLIRTRYGPALLVNSTKEFISVQPLLQWKQKEIEEMDLMDVKFLKSFPIQVNSDLTIEYGRYGLYLIHKKKNLRLPKDMWEKVYEKTYTPKDIEAFVT
jgi:DNA topoisomerase-1